MRTIFHAKLTADKRVEGFVDVLFIVKLARPLRLKHSKLLHLA